MPTVPADQANMDQNLDNNALFNTSNIHHCLSVASCSIANCRCANFNADVNNTRYCDRCHHSWFSHEADAADVDWHAAGRTRGWLDFLRPLAIVDRTTLLPLENRETSAASVYEKRARSAAGVPWP
ncbi:hypothetical protein T10_7146 [Trichinella papuae]|uniref:Zinc finger protein basonuclin-2 n=1 Tax=Trichinella papuae TaxID=268474 RepID=A0A0V1MAT6_9BILA|nr:hypothetical protein T10_7146 [Trichinella papuae]